jgi:hypothetical protein
MTQAIEDPKCQPVIVQDKVSKLIVKAPGNFDFMPTKKIYRKLILRACQIKDVINELNPMEAKTDPR